MSARNPKYDPNRVGPLELEVLIALVRQENDSERPAQREAWIRKYTAPGRDGHQAAWTASLPPAFAIRSDFNTGAVYELELHPEAPLITEITAPNGAYPMVPVIALSDAGRQHYRRYVADYRELYPHLDPPDLRD